MQPRILIVEARFYQDIADELAKGAVSIIEEIGTPYERLEVPGVFEIPAAVRFAIRSTQMQTASHGGYCGFIVLGCVIRGATDHYEYINRSTIQALMDMTVDYNISMGFGIITCENHQQAVERASVEQKNIGARAATACLRMMEIKKDLHLLML